MGVEEMEEPKARSLRCSTNIRGRLIPLIVRRGRYRFVTGRGKVVQRLVEYVPATWEEPDEVYDDASVRRVLERAKERRRLVPEDVYILCPGAYWKIIQAEKNISRYAAFRRLPLNVLLEFGWNDEEFEELWRSIRPTPMLRLGLLLISVRQIPYLVRAIVVGIPIYVNVEWKEED